MFFINRHTNLQNQTLKLFTFPKFQVQRIDVDFKILRSVGFLLEEVGAKKEFSEICFVVNTPDKY